MQAFEDSLWIRTEAGDLQKHCIPGRCCSVGYDEEPDIRSQWSIVGKENLELSLWKLQEMDSNVMLELHKAVKEMLAEDETLKMSGLMQNPPGLRVDSDTGEVEPGYRRAITKTKPERKSYCV